jgi:hypothetical protein
MARRGATAWPLAPFVPLFPMFWLGFPRVVPVF